MPLLTVKLVEEVFTPEQKRRVIEDMGGRSFRTEDVRAVAAGAAAEQR